MSKYLSQFSNIFTLTFNDKRLNQIYSKNKNSTINININKIFLSLNWIISTSGTIIAFANNDYSLCLELKILMLILSILNFLFFSLFFLIRKYGFLSLVGIFQTFSYSVNFYFFSIFTRNNHIAFNLIFSIFPLFLALFMHQVENTPYCTLISFILFNLVLFLIKFYQIQVYHIVISYSCLSVILFLLSYTFNIYLKNKFLADQKIIKNIEKLNNLISKSGVNYLKIKNNLLKVNHSFISKYLRFFPELESILFPSNQVLIPIHTSTDSLIDSNEYLQSNEKCIFEKLIHLSDEMFVEFLYSLFFNLTTIEDSKFNDNTPLKDLHEYIRENGENELEKKKQFMNTFRKFVEEFDYSEGFIRIGSKKSQHNNEKFLFNIFIYSMSNKLEDIEILILDYTERVSLEELNKIVKNKNIFFSKISHDLKNSLMMLKSLSHKLCLKLKCIELEKNNDSYIECLKNLSRDIYKFSDFLKDLSMDYNKMGSSDNEVFDLKMSKIKITDIAKFTENITLIWKNLKKKENLKFQSNISGNLIDKYVETDKIRLKQILLNLVSNSVKFSYEGYITLSISEEIIDYEPYLKISLSDEGRGIDLEKISHIFDPYKKNLSQYDIEGNSEGVGLGLSIVKFLTTKLGKPIDIERDRYKGACFFFYIRNRTSFNQKQDSKEINWLPNNILHKSNKNINKTYEHFSRPKQGSSKKTFFQKKSKLLNSPGNDSKLKIVNNIHDTNSSLNSAGDSALSCETRKTNILKIFNKKGMTKILGKKAKKKKNVHLPFLSPVKNNAENRRKSERFNGKKSPLDKFNLNINAQSVNINNYSISIRKKRSFSLFEFKNNFSPKSIRILNNEGESISEIIKEIEVSLEKEYELNKSKQAKNRSPNKKCRFGTQKIPLAAENKTFVKLFSENKKNQASNCKLINFTQSISQKVFEEKICFIVDDEYLIRESMRNILLQYSKSRKIPLKIVECEDGVNALYEYYKCDQKGKYVSLIITDETMEYINGSNLASILRSCFKNFYQNKTGLFLVSADNPENHSNKRDIFDKIIAKGNKSVLYCCLDEHFSFNLNY